MATSTHQFARTLGGTIGVGISGGLVTWRLSAVLAQLASAEGHHRLTAAVSRAVKENLENLLRPEIQAQLAPGTLAELQQAVGQGVAMAFGCVLAAAGLCLICCLMLPWEETKSN